MAREAAVAPRGSLRVRCFAVVLSKRDSNLARWFRSVVLSKRDSNLARWFRSVARVSGLLVDGDGSENQKVRPVEA